MAQLPVGSDSAQVQTWAASHGVKFMFLQEQQEFYSNVERVPVKGIPFPCGEWNIIITVRVDSAGHSTANDIHKVGTCV